MSKRQAGFEDSGCEDGDGAVDKNGVAGAARSHADVPDLLRACTLQAPIYFYTGS